MSDFDWPALTDSEQAKLLKEMLADAWDEGYESACRWNAPPASDVNPYRGG